MALLYAESNAYLRNNDIFEILLLTVRLFINIRSLHGLLSQLFKIYDNLSNKNVLMVF